MLVFGVETMHGTLRCVSLQHPSRDNMQLFILRMPLFTMTMQYISSFKWNSLMQLSLPYLSNSIVSWYTFMSSSRLGPVNKSFISLIVQVSSGPILIIKHGLLDCLMVTSNYFSIGSKTSPGFLSI